METTKKTIWVLKNHTGYFVKACATREIALAEMNKWRNNMAKCGLFEYVSEVSAAFYNEITFIVKDRYGATRKLIALETPLQME